MATVEDVAALALSAVDVTAERPIGIAQVGRWVESRYRELVARTRFRHLRRVGTIAVPAALDTGTVTVVAGSTSVTLDATAQAAVAAAGGNAAITGRFLRLHTVWYEIASYAAPTITLATAYSEADVTAGGYLLLARFHTLTADVRWLGKFVFPRRRRVLTPFALHDLDRIAPERQITSDGPWYVAEAANASTGAKRVELYPYSLTAETISFVYWAIPAATTLDTVLPSEVDPYVLREGVLIDLYRYRASQEANAGRIEAAGYWRNEARAQATSWERQIMDAAKADRGQDDVSFIFNVLGLGRGGRRDIVTASDEVWARGRRP